MKRHLFLLCSLVTIGAVITAVCLKAVAQNEIVAQQRIIKISGDESWSLSRTLTKKAYHTFEFQGTRAAVDQAFEAKTFLVYTAPEVDSKFAKISAVNEITKVNGIIDLRIAAAEKRLNDQMNDQIKKTGDDLSQSLMSEEARRQIREQVTLDLRGDLSQLRNELKALKDEVDELKKPRRRR
jgi:predicted lysophospholipase L1 biosynthesis ABC-type transport system permease subunit